MPSDAIRPTVLAIDTSGPVAGCAVLREGRIVHQVAMNHGLTRRQVAQQILDASEAFWPYVESGEMPEVSGSDTASDYIKDKYAVGTPDLEKEADESLQKYVADYKAASAAEKDAKAKKDEAGNRIKVFMGDATVVPGFCTWKNAKDSQKIDWQAVAEVAMANMSVLEREELVAKYTETKPGNRTLRITAKGF